jgi:hypothetical protein
MEVRYKEGGWMWRSLLDLSEEGFESVHALLATYMKEKFDA